MPKQRLAKYPNLRTHRENLGWRIADLQAAMQHPPSERTIKRLEDGFGVRTETVNRIFNAVEKEYSNKLFREEEVIRLNQ